MERSFAAECVEVRLAVTVFCGMIAFVLALGAIVFVVSKMAVQRFIEYGSDPSRMREVAARIAHFRLPPGYHLSTSWELPGSRFVELRTPDDSTVFTLTGTDLPNYTDSNAWTAALTPGCGGLRRMPDIRDRSNGRTFVSEVYECRNVPFQLGITPVRGRMAYTFVTTATPSGAWPSYDLDAHLSQSIRP